MDEIISFVDGNFCEESETGRHYAESYLYERYELDDGTWDWRYRCVCEYCFESFYASAEALAAAYSNYVSTLDSTTISSDDLTSTATTYLYNGVELPALPDWDQEAYPYACIVRAWSGSYCFIATKSPAYVRNSTIASSSNDLVLDWDSNSMRCFLASDRLSWGIPSLSTAYGDVLFYRKSSGNDIFMWANYDVYYGSSLYLAASEPVFVSGSVSTSTTNDRFGLYMEELDEWNKTYGYDANEYAANYFITPDNGDSLYSPAVFSESTMTFTEPVTGEQFLCSSWTYDYTGDNTLVFCGYPIEGTYYGSYILDLAEPVTINGRSISNYWIVYMDDSIWIIPYYFSDSGLFCVPSGSAQSYSFVMVSQSECGIGNHTYTYETVTEATCSTPGERKYICSVCGDEYAEDIPATGNHTYKSSVTQEATCAASGVMTYTCSTCGTEYTETIAPTGVHSYEYSVAVDPTCTADGTGLYICSVCGDQYTETLPATGHSGTLIEYVSPEYDENGNLTVAGYSVYECTICGAQYTVSDEVTAEKEGFFSWLWNQFSKLIESIFDGLASGIKYLLENIIGAITDWIIRIVNWVFDLFDGDALSSFFGWFSDDNEILNADFGVSSSTEVDVWAYS